MDKFGAFRDQAGRALALALPFGALLAAAVQPALAQERIRHPMAHLRAAGQPARTLTVHRRTRLYANVRRSYGVYEGPALVRRWNDPNLYSFGGWRIGGDSFYGDTHGDTITRGNATLGAIAGYGPARGGYGGPHFDSVGGFHNGPGPDAQEDADYASGSISTPIYSGEVPHYPSVKQRVVALNRGVVSRTSPRLIQAGLREPVGALRPIAAPEAEDGPEFLRSDDLFPDLGIDVF